MRQRLYCQHSIEHKKGCVACVICALPCHLCAYMFPWFQHPHELKHQHCFMLPQNFQSPWRSRGGTSIIKFKAISQDTRGYRYVCPRQATRLELAGDILSARGTCLHIFLINLYVDQIKYAHCYSQDHLEKKMFQWNQPLKLLIFYPWFQFQVLYFQYLIKYQQ